MHWDELLTWIHARITVSNGRTFEISLNSLLFVSVCAEIIRNWWDQISPFFRFAFEKGEKAIFGFFVGSGSEWVCASGCERVVQLLCTLYGHECMKIYIYTHAVRFKWCQCHMKSTHTNYWKLVQMERATAKKRIAQKSQAIIEISICIAVIPFAAFSLFWRKNENQDQIVQTWNHKQKKRLRVWKQ